MARSAAVRPAEIILGVAAGVGGWLIVGAHALILAVIPRAECGADPKAFWGGTLLLGALAAFGALGLGLGLPWRSGLRWGALFVAPLVAYDLWWIAPALASTTLGDTPLCAFTASGATGAGIVAVERAWPPLQLGVLAFAGFQSLRYWRSPSDAAPSA